MVLLDVLEDRTLPQRDDLNVDAGCSEDIDLRGFRGDPVGAEDRRRAMAETSAGQRRVGNSPAQPPAARVVPVDIPADVADVDNIEVSALGVS